MLSQPHKHLHHWKIKKNKKLSKQPTVYCPLKTTQRFDIKHMQCREGHSTYEVGHAGNTLHIGTFYTLTPKILMHEMQHQLGYVELW